MRVLMVSMFFCFISAMPELAVSRVKRARAWTYASLSSCYTDITPNNIASEIFQSPEESVLPSGESAVPVWWRCRLSWWHTGCLQDRERPHQCHHSPGVPHWTQPRRVSMPAEDQRQIKKLIQPKCPTVKLSVSPSITLNMGLTCSRCVALVKGAWTWLTASISALAVLAICSISTL